MERDFFVQSLSFDGPIAHIYTFQLYIADFYLFAILVVLDLVSSLYGLLKVVHCCSLTIRCTQFCLQPLVNYPFLILPSTSRSSGCPGVYVAIDMYTIMQRSEEVNPEITKKQTVRYFLFEQRQFSNVD